MVYGSMVLIFFFTDRGLRPHPWRRRSAQTTRTQTRAACAPSRPASRFFFGVRVALGDTSPDTPVRVITRALAHPRTTRNAHPRTLLPGAPAAGCQLPRQRVCRCVSLSLQSMPCISTPLHTLFRTHSPHTSARLRTAYVSKPLSPSLPLSVSHVLSLSLSPSHAPHLHPAPPSTYTRFRAVTSTRTIRDMEIKTAAGSQRSPSGGARRRGRRTEQGS